jgi:predicted Fe-Mo cluster-binding NifX family protein
MRRIAVPARDGHIDDHFGHCDHYLIYSVEEKKIIDIQRMECPQGCGCKSGVATTLAQMGVTVMLAGNMGDGAKNKLQEAGIKVIRGCRGEIDTVVTSYLAGFLVDSGEGCHSHECGSH